MQKQRPKKDWKRIILLSGVILLLSFFFYWGISKAFASGWLLGIGFTLVLQVYRKFMYARIFKNFEEKWRVAVDVIVHQLLVLAIVIVPFVISVIYRQWFDPIAVFLAFFGERLYWLVTHYFNEKRRV